MSRLRVAAALFLLPLATARVIMFGDSLLSEGEIKGLLEAKTGGRTSIENYAISGASFRVG